MILYFSGTGNSKFVANALADFLGDEIMSLNSILKEHGETRFYSDKPFVVVTPIYAWRIPQVVTELLERSTFSGSNKFYFIATMGGQSGNCVKYCNKICINKGMQFMGLGSVLMPSNYVTAEPMADKTTIEKIINSALPVISDYASRIKKESFIEKSKNDTISMPTVLSGPVNVLYRKFMVSSKNFVASDKCISCGKCERVCALNNIKMLDGKPKFGDKCIHCYACIHNCPKAAIDVKGKTENNGRYLCKEYKKGSIISNS
ncbi:EFR1 family ferrodoxin [Clostridium sp. C8-1-8]|uniref:EFR1 family ferrodoxin n=1 Tax=Clostridium sp. C8-1-8 TaxID=2698831 RepID=UPI00136D7326|nr:EFR1 family ferrodoxin [Clostridium sp. C8-1-8]